MRARPVSAETTVMNGANGCSRAAHIVLATDRVSPGGVSHFMLQLATHFSSKGHRVDVVALGPGEWDARLIERGIQVHTLPSFKVIQLMRSADIVHCHQRIFGLLAIMAGARSRTIEHVHNVMSGYKLFSYRPPTIVAVSDHVRISLQKNYPRLSNRNVTVVRNGARKLAGNPLPFSDRTYDLIGVGRLEEQKDPLMLLEIAHRMRRSRNSLRALWLAPGDGTLKSQFLQRRAVLDLNETVELVIGGTHEETCRLVSQSKVFVMTSKWEGLPLAALEALAGGTPVATTPCGEISDIVGQSGSGAQLTDDADVNASVLLEMTLDESAWVRASANAFTVADEFSEESMVSAIEEVYSAICPSIVQCHPSGVQMGEVTRA